jgi:hypothetical protein
MAKIPDHHINQLRIAIQEAPEKRAKVIEDYCDIFDEMTPEDVEAQLAEEEERSDIIKVTLH